ncbi:MAG: hypothetical protein HFF51_05595 [Lawsonibacter sp.]|nr:hypothetical protein [Lawsonibacter sp.]
MKNRKRLGALALALVLSLAALSGCGPKPSGSAGSGSASGSGSGSSDSITPMDLSQVTDPALAVAGVAGEEVLVKLGTAEITANDYLYWLQRSISDYLEPFGGQMTTLPWDTEMSDNLTFGQYMLDNALDAAALHCMLRELARQENLSPDPKVATQVDKQYADMVVQAGSDESRVIHTLWTQMLSRELLTTLNENTELFDQLAELYYGENSGHYPTDAEVNAYLDEVGRYKAKHILLATIDLDTREPLDEATVAQKKAQAEDFLAQLRAAEDPIALFDDLMNEHSEDSGLATNPDGYTTAKGEMVAPFEEAALALKAGEISEVVESDFGYHIILRLPLDPDDFRDDCVGSLMEKRIDQEIERLGLEKTAAFDKLNVGDFWDKLQSLQYAVQIEMAS